MKKLKLLKKAQKLHFIGIGGISMFALAKYCTILGYTVSGSDERSSSFTHNLQECGLDICIGHDEKNVYNVDAVIVTSAIGKDNPELNKALKKRIPVIKRSKLLGEIISCFDTSVAISGSHGKTTTTAMITEALTTGGKVPTAFIGGESQTLGNFICGNEDVVITEACEYSKSFLDLKPTIAVALNIDNDHLDCYKNMANLTRAFKQFLSGRISVVNADDERLRYAKGVCAVTFGVKNQSAFKAEKIRLNQHGGYSFSIYKYGVKLGRINLKVLGKHNIYNALATVAVCNILGVDFNAVKKSLENFSGVKRRMERLGLLYGKTVYADYAHHPSEINATLSAFNDKKQQDVIIFQPHTYSRTRLLKNDFVNALSDCQNLIIYSTYPAREEFDAKGSAFSLYREIKKQNKKVRYATTIYELLSMIKKESAKKGRVLILGAGDLYDIIKSKIVL